MPIFLQPRQSESGSRAAGEHVQLVGDVDQVARSGLRAVPRRSGTRFRNHLVPSGCGELNPVTRICAHRRTQGEIVRTTAGPYLHSRRPRFLHRPEAWAGQSHGEIHPGARCTAFRNQSVRTERRRGCMDARTAVLQRAPVLSIEQNAIAWGRHAYASADSSPESRTNRQVEWVRSTRSRIVSKSGSGWRPKMLRSAWGASGR